MSIMNIKNGNIVDAVVNAIVSGYRDDIVLEELAQGLENEDITKDQFTAAIEGLKLYIARFADSVKGVTDAMQQFEFNETQSIIKNRPMNLAQQVMQDVDGFKKAVGEFYDDEDEAGKASSDNKASVEQKADIKKPNLDAAPVKGQPALKEKPAKAEPEKKQSCPNV